MSGAFPVDLAGRRWCPDCSGYGSSLKQESERCTTCGGTGLVPEEDEEQDAGEPPAARQHG